MMIIFSLLCAAASKKIVIIIVIMLAVLQFQGSDTHNKHKHTRESFGKMKNLCSSTLIDYSAASYFCCSNFQRTIVASKARMSSSSKQAERELLLSQKAFSTKPKLYCVGKMYL